jgi:uncharacterized protein YcnI
MLTCSLQTEELQFTAVADVNFVTKFHSPDDTSEYDEFVLARFGSDQLPQSQTTDLPIKLGCSSPI